MLDRDSGTILAAQWQLDETASMLVVQSSRGPGCSRDLKRSCALAEVRNVWVAADSELCRRIYSTCRPESRTASSSTAPSPTAQAALDRMEKSRNAELGCLMLIDAPMGPIALLERTSELREEFLDCLAVLICAQRLRNEPDAACRCLLDGPPPPEARLRPFGRSLQSSHLSGPICAWLARVAEDALPSEDGHGPDRGPNPSTPSATRLLQKLGSADSAVTNGAVTNGAVTNGAVGKAAPPRRLNPAVCLSSPNPHKKVQHSL